MKGLKNYLRDDRARNVCMTVNIEETDDITFTSVYDFDFLYDALTNIKKEIGSRKKQTRKIPHDNRIIQLKFKRSTGDSQIILFRVIRENENTMHPVGAGYVALAPVCVIDDEKGKFVEYDEIHKNDITITLPAYVNLSEVPVYSEGDLE